MPSVSVVLPALDEAASIGACLRSLCEQDYTALEEILVVDGGSTDATRAMVESIGPPVRLLDNPRVTAAAAMNIGLAAAQGDIVCRADAHTTYATDYVRRCVEVLLETGATVVGGPMRPVGATPFGRAVAAVTSTPIGVGPGRFHYAERRMEVDTVYLGCWWRQRLIDVGGFDEEGLQWAAEDHELNFRIRAAGGTVVVDPSIRSWYEPRGTPGALWRQYRNYGTGKASTLAKHRSLPSWRPLAPAALVAAAVVGAVAGRGPRRLAVPLAHALACAVAAVALSRRQPGPVDGEPDAARVFGALWICHWAYGIGFWAGLVRLASGRPFDSRPRRGR